jgi:hypothetical protein
VEAVVRPHDLGVQTLLVLLEERRVATQPGEETDNSPFTEGLKLLSKSLSVGVFSMLKPKAHNS